MRLEGWGGHMVRDGASRLLTMRPNYSAACLALLPCADTR
jgi:hypothetical protein